MKNCEHCQNLRINNCSNNTKLATATVNTTTPTIKMKIPKKTTTAANFNAANGADSAHYATKTIATPKVARPAAGAAATTTRTATTTTVTTNQLCQNQHRHLQRCSSSSVGSSIVGSICADTVSSYSGSATDSVLTIPTPPPTAPPTNSFHYLHQHNNAGNNNGNNSNHQPIAFPSNKSKTVLPPSNGATLSANNATTTQPGIQMATRAPLNKTQNVTGMLPTGAPSQPLPPVIQQHLLNSPSSSTTATAGGLPSQQQQHLAPPPPASAATLPPLVGGLGAAAMAADLAQSFSLLHQQAYHFRDILYAAHLLGRGYYQPAGPLISHVLPPVSAGPPIPPNVPLLAATATKIKSQTPTAANTVDSNEHIPGAGQTNPTTTEPPDADLLITGGDLTHFRYPAHSSSGGASPASAAAHHSQQQQQQHHHQLHQQAAAAAAAAAHQSSPYPRSMHAQMHYSTAYPANYYSPYPGEPMCYSPPAYQPYFPTKVYQSAPPPPPPPHHSAYRRYPYYQPGHPPPADLYEQAPPPPPAAGTAPPPSCPPPSQSGVPPPPQGGSQLVPAGPAAHTQHLEHYPAPPGYYPSYSPGGGGAGQCYTRSIQAPYMDYPPQCPCPMQQSCPKNVHTGPHIGSNSNSNSNSKNVNSSSSTSNSNSNNITAIINHCNNNNLNVALSHTNNRNISKIISNTSNNNSSNTSSNNLTMNVGNNNINSSSSSMNSNNSSSHALTTSRGPVKNVVSTSVTTNCTNNTQTPFVEKEARREAPKTLPLLSIAVKTEIAADDTDNKSQYEESVLTPLTPPESYTTNEDKLKDNLDKDAVTAIPLEEDIEEAIDKLQSNNPHQQLQQQRAGNTHLLAIATPIEAYDLTTTTPPLQNNTLQATATATTQSTRHAVGRRARIGKSMAWNMVYAGAASQQTPTLTAFSRLQITSPTNCNIPNSAQRPPLTAQNPPQHNNNKHVSGGSNITTSSSTPANVTNVTNNIITKQEMEEITTPLLLKAEIKAEKIKLEDELLDSVLQQHTSVSQLAPPSTQKHIIPDKNELKVIKAEPVTLSEVLNESKVKIENDCEVIKMIVSKEVETDIEEQNPNTTLNKPAGRMRLLPSRQQPLISTPVSLTAVNCDIDLSNASDEELLDLCHSPAVGSSSGKRIKILEFNKNQCKKSPPNSYKSLIKQAEPKTYLCLSRKIDKKSRFGKLHSSRSGKNNATNNSLRRRELILTDQQKQRLRLRKKKLAALEKTKREAKEVRRAEIKERRKQAKQPQAKSRDRPLNGKHNIDKTDEGEKPSVVNLIEEEDEEIKCKSQTGGLYTAPDYTNTTSMCGKLTKSMDNSPLTTPKPSPRRGKPTKKPSIPLHVIGTVDAVSRGYFSEPELRSANVLTLPISRKDIPKAKVEEEEARKPLVIKIQKKYKSTSEKRSKSETKKPIKSSALHANEDILNLHTLTRPVLDLSSHKDSVFKQTTSKMAEDGLIKQNQCELSTKDIPKEPKVSSKKLTISKKSRSNDSKSKKEGKTKKSLSHCNGKKSKSTKKSNDLESGEANVTDPIMVVIDDSRSLETLKPTSPESTCDIVETNNNEYNKVAIDKTVPSTSVAELRIEDTILSDYEEQLNDNTLSGGVEKSGKFTGQALSSSQSPLTLSENSATKEEMEQQHSSDTHSTTPVFLQPTIPPMPRVVCHSHHHQHVGKRNRSRSKFGSRKRQKLKHSTVSFELDETLPAIPRSDVVPKWNNGWTWEGEPFQGAVFLNSDDPLVIRTCYPAMRHLEGDIIRSRDCVLLKANDENELPYVAKVAHLWENPEDGEMMMSLLWYYRPEHTEQGRQPSDSSDEVYASRHRDHNSVACIEDKCYVLTFSEYCRYRRRVRAAEEDIEDVNIVPKRPNYYSIRIVPDNTNPELVMFCRRAYEFRTKRLLKMPNKQDYYVVTS